MFSALWARIKEIVAKMFGMNQTIEQQLGITPAVSNKMVEAIDEWTLMYEDQAEWLHEPDTKDPTMVVSLGLPAFISSEKARMAVLELKSEITAPKKTETKENPKYFPPQSDAFGNVKVSGEPKTVIEETTIGDTARADYMNEQYQTKLLSKIRTQLEYGIAKGSLIIKPYVVRHRMSGVEGIDNTENPEMNEENVEYTYEMNYDFIQADCFYPFSFNSSGDLIDVAFIQTKVDKEMTYTRLERHRLEGNNVIIENKAFEAKQTDAFNDPSIGYQNLGKEIPLTKVPEWKDIPAHATVKNVSKLLFGYFKMPDANTIDPHSPLGMSGFAKAKYLIREADKQYSRLLWEYEGGELAIDIDRDALEFMNNTDGTEGGHSVPPKLQKRLWRTIDLGESDTYKPYSPALRDSSLINGLNCILMRIEDVCALSRGTISDVAAEARTATELKILRQRSYSSNLEIQHALEAALKDTVYAMNVYCTLYNIVGDITYDKSGNVETDKIGQYEVSFMWDDSILVDVESELQKRLTLKNEGLESKVGLRMWYYGETEKQARDALAKIDDERQEAIEKNMMVSSQLGESIGKGQQDVKQAQQGVEGNPEKQEKISNESENDSIPPNA